MATTPRATAAHDQAPTGPQTQRTTFSRFPEGVPCIVVLPGRGHGKHQSQDRYLNRRGGFTAQRRLARRFKTRADAIAPANTAWSRVIGALYVEPADPVAGVHQANPSRTMEALIPADELSHLRETAVGFVQEALAAGLIKPAEVGVMTDAVEERDLGLDDGPGQRLARKVFGTQGGTMVPPPAARTAGAGLRPAAGPNRAHSGNYDTAAPVGSMPTAVAPTGTSARGVPVTGGRDSGVFHERSGLGRIATRNLSGPGRRQATTAELARLTQELHA